MNKKALGEKSRLAQFEFLRSPFTVKAPSLRTTIFQRASSSEAAGGVVLGDKTRFLVFYLLHSLFFQCPWCC
ncbi:MAG: hypothetical protein HUK21_07315 [Fibrobacteraceae bacterium]|nr:hypothetical protein [Fibrobacteraceae bacterium]